MVLTLLRATSRKAFGSLVSRKIAFNRNDKSDNNENGQQDEQKDADKKNQCRLEGFIDFQRMVFHSIGIFGSLIIIGHKFHTDCVRIKSSGPFVATGKLENVNTCSFLEAFNANLPDLKSAPFYPPQHLDVHPLQVLPGPSSSYFSKNNDDHHRDSTDEVTDSNNIIERIVNGMRSELDLFTDELKNIQASVLLQSNQIDKAIHLLKSCPKSAKAMFNLGIVYESGQHDPINGIPNYSNALKYYTNAASLGHQMAHYNLGLIYLYGKKPIQADRAKAMSLLHRAAELGVEEAQSFVNQERLVYSQMRDIRIRHSQQLFEQLSDENAEKASKVNQNSNFHTSRSSPNFLTTIMSYLEPSVKEPISKLSSLIDNELLTTKEEPVYDSSDSLEINFTCNNC